MRLADKVIAITGSGSGLGRRAAQLFAEHGAKLVVSDVVPGRADAAAELIEGAGDVAVGSRQPRDAAPQSSSRPTSASPTTSPPAPCPMTSDPT